MYIKGSFFTKTCYLVLSLLLITLLMSKAFAQSSSSKSDNTDLQEKLYRQALFYYFQGDKDNALVMMERGHEKLGQLDSRSSLFEAGLQLSQGMLLQAHNTLIKFESNLAKETIKKQTVTVEQLAITNELLVVALLTLTERFLEQGEQAKAQHSLKQINQVPSQYYAQYHLLNQLAFWPHSDESLPLVLANSSEQKARSTVDDELLARYQIAKEKSPYIQLNNALLLLEQNNTDAAGALLTQIKSTPWHQPSLSFWQTLFAETVTNLDEKTAESQAIQDYAQLLLAQSYVKQQRFDLAYTELKAFPSNGPYAESAVFLFAFAAQNVQQYAVANKLLTLHFRKYPFSPLAWQSAELMAEQVSQQQSLAQGVSAYQKVEAYFKQRIKSLHDFQQAFSKANNLLEFSPIGANDSHLKNESLAQYLPQSPWLQHALLDSQLSSLYQGLLDIDEQIMQSQALLEKTEWLAEIISLNQARKQRVVKQLQQQNYPEKIQALQLKRNTLAKQLAENVEQPLAATFADKTQLKWLQRITRSETAIATISPQKNTSDYQQRLTRLKGVLAWQMSEQHSDRAWQHQQQLKQVDSAIAGLTKRQNTVKQLSLSEANLSAKMLKQTQSKVELQQLIAKLTVLRKKMTALASSKVALFIDEQSLLLNEHLLSTRRGMAKVLEKMSEVDRKMAIKLSSSKLASSFDNRQPSPKNVNALNLQGEQ